MNDNKQMISCNSLGKTRPFKLQQLLQQRSTLLPRTTAKVFHPLSKIQFSPRNRLQIRLNIEEQHGEYLKKMIETQKLAKKMAKNQSEIRINYRQINTRRVHLSSKRQLQDSMRIAETTFNEIKRISGQMDGILKSLLKQIQIKTV